MICLTIGGGTALPICLILSLFEPNNLKSAGNP